VIKRGATTRSRGKKKGKRKEDLRFLSAPVPNFMRETRKKGKERRKKKKKKSRTPGWSKLAWYRFACSDAAKGKKRKKREEDVISILLIFVIAADLTLGERGGKGKGEEKKKKKSWR